MRLLREVQASVHGAVDPSALRAEGVDPAAIVDFSSNQSPLGPAPGVAEAVAGAVVDAYPDPRATELAAALAARHGVEPSQVVCSNGSTELIRLIAQLALAPGDVALALTPVFGECEVATRLAGAVLERVPLVQRGPGAGFFCDEPALRSALSRLRPRLCWLCSPNNPTGAALPAELTAELVATHPDILFVLDEAYCDLLPEPQWERASLAHGNLVVLHSMTKYWGLAGLRLGHAVAGDGIAAALRAAAPPWSVNACAQAAGVAALADLTHHRRSVDLLTAERDRLVAGLHELGWVTEPTAAGFFLIHAGDARALRSELLSRGRLVRDCTSFGLPSHVRVSPRHPAQNDLLLASFAELEAPRPQETLTGTSAASRKASHSRPLSSTPQPGARAVMCVGTGSHAGKSVIAAALCRIYARRGYRVAPFKAQNMALNSYVTPEGGELGRAQAYQARAAGVEPHVDMNPVLLKPSSQTGSQVIVLGRPVRHMDVLEYHAYQAEVWPIVTAAYQRLRAVNDLIVIEGAGSPAEVNLRGQDIVNMRVAQYAQAPTLLIGDIDRGGVFASLVGHMELFTPEERDLVAAFVINKFRGDASLLDSGLDFLLERTGVPTLGVVPMLADWRGDEEDSLGIDERRRPEASDAPLRIAVVRLPFISNYTDFDALADEPDVNVHYVTTPAELERAAAIVLPGTKSTIADLVWLRESGVAAAVAARAAAGTPVIGVCGGYQMLGRRIRDPERVESDAGSVDGLGLLDVETTFAGEKRTVRVEGEVLGVVAGGAGLLGPGGTALHGYEIHMGRTTLGRGAAPLLRLRGAEGSAHEDGAVAAVSAAGPGAVPRVCGSYVHGIFDHPELRAAFLNGLRAELGLPLRESSAPSPDDDIDRLADHVETHLEPDLLTRIIGLEPRTRQPR